MKILLTGGSGTLGRYLRMQNSFIFAPSHVEMDITDRYRVVDVVHDYKPEVVVHAAAYTDVAGAEKNREECWNINVAGTYNLLAACKRFSVHFIYVSTACVFPGDSDKGYTEEDIPYPCNFYGLTKLLGEILVRRTQRKDFRYLIVRTNFVKRGTWRYPRAFTDRWGSYMYADEVAAKILFHVSEGTTGTIHVCGDKRVSMFELARQYSPEVQPITLEQYYMENPDAPTLTQDMTLKTVREDI